MKFTLFNNLNRVLSANDRISSVDIWRGLAIIAVVLYHFNSTLPYGYLGVDLFFVISGLLVGGILTKPFLKGEKISFFNFFFRRGYKIWPSYYTFLIFGTIIATITYSEQNAHQIIPLSDFKRYLLFYQNYTGAPFHWSFDHVWSLCVEEHFYILLPILIIALSMAKAGWKTLLTACIILILLGFFFKIYMLYFTGGQDTFSATHNRIDALAWGVLLNLLIIRFSDSIKKYKGLWILFIIGALGLFLAVIVDAHWQSLFYHKVVLHSIMPMFFFLMILGTYYFDLSKLKTLRTIGYYSYNWYLWHPVFVVVITQITGATYYGLFLYLIASFAAAVFFTTTIEEPFLKMRKQILARKKIQA